MAETQREPRLSCYSDTPASNLGMGCGSKSVGHPLTQGMAGCGHQPRAGLPGGSQLPCGETQGVLPSRVTQSWAHKSFIPQAGEEPANRAAQVSCRPEGPQIWCWPPALAALGPGKPRRGQGTASTESRLSWDLEVLGKLVSCFLTGALQSASPPLCVRRGPKDHSRPLGAHSGALQGGCTWLPDDLC